MKTSAQLPIVLGSNTLGGIVAERPQTAVVFERLGLDYCCGGQKTLEEASMSRAPTTSLTLRSMNSAITSFLLTTTRCVRTSLGSQS